MDPSGPSQPSLDTAYKQPANPAASSYEKASSNTPAKSFQRSAPTVERREPNDAIGGGGNNQEEATPTSVAYGARDASGDVGESAGGPVSSLEGEQMRAPGEGDIAAAQEDKHGFGEQGDLASGLDRKKAEQASIKEARGASGDGGGSGDVDVQGAIGGGNKGFVGGSGETARDSETGAGLQSSHQHV